MWKSKVTRTCGKIPGRDSGPRFARRPVDVLGEPVEVVFAAGEPVGGLLPLREGKDVAPPQIPVPAAQPIQALLLLEFGEGEFLFGDLAVDLRAAPKWDANSATQRTPSSFAALVTVWTLPAALFTLAGLSVVAGAAGWSGLRRDDDGPRAG